MHVQCVTCCNISVTCIFSAEVCEVVEIENMDLLVVCEELDIVTIVVVLVVVV